MNHRAALLDIFVTIITGLYEKFSCLAAVVAAAFLAASCSLTEWDIFKTETGYAAVVKMAPVIDLYYEDMNLLNSVDISDIPVIERKVKDIEKSREASAPGTLTVYYQFGDSYYSDGKLYILCFTVNDDPADSMKNLCNTVVVLDVDGDTCRYTGQLVLPDKYYWCICVTSDGRLIASNAMQSQLEVFDLR